MKAHPNITPAEFEAFAEELKVAVDHLGVGLRARFYRRGDVVEITVTPIDLRRPALNLSAGHRDFSLSVGPGWIDEMRATPQNAAWLLAILDALRGGRVRTVHMQDPLMPAYVLLLKTRGLREYAWIGRGDGGKRLMKAGKRKVRSYPVAGWGEALP